MSKASQWALAASGLLGGGYLLNKGLSNYIYNSVKLNPYSYEPEYILSSLRPALARVSFGFNPSLNALNIGDVWDFRVNDTKDAKDTKRIYGDTSYWMRKLITSLFEDKVSIILGLK